jgi:hypothetical protein
MNRNKNYNIYLIKFELTLLIKQQSKVKSQFRKYLCTSKIATTARDMIQIKASTKTQSKTKSNYSHIMVTFTTEK